MVLTACGGSGSNDAVDDTSAAASADAARIAQNAAAEASAQASASAQAKALLSAALPACEQVRDAVSSLQNEITAAELRHDEAKTKLNAASDLLSDVPSLEAVSLNAAVAEYVSAILTENLTMLRQYPGVTPDQSRLKQQYEESCVRGAGAEPLTID